MGERPGITHSHTHCLSSLSPGTCRKTKAGVGPWNHSLTHAFLPLLPLSWHLQEDKGMGRPLESLTHSCISSSPSSLLALAGRQRHGEAPGITHSLMHFFLSPGTCRKTKAGVGPWNHSLTHAFLPLLPLSWHLQEDKGMGRPLESLTHSCISSSLLALAGRQRLG